MQDILALPQSVPSLSELTKATLNGSSANSFVQSLTEAAQHYDYKDDPWLSFVERLWEVNPVSGFVPLDVSEILSLYEQVWLDVLTDPMRLFALYDDFVQKATSLTTTSILKFWGLGQGLKPVVEPEKDDRRFSAPEWQQNVAFDALKQSYLLMATTWFKAVSGIKTLDERERHRLLLFLREFIDAMSPTNFALTNPQVIQETIATGGQNLLKGMRNFLRDVNNRELTITDRSAFTVGKELGITPGQVIYRNKLIELIQYSPTTEQVYKTPILHIPPWVNKFYLLDLQPKNSLVKFLVDQGFTVFMISWKNPDDSMEEVSFDDYVTLGPLAALDVIKQITDSPTVNVAGYCISGQMLATVPPYLAAQGDNETINSATFVVTLADTQAQLNDLLALIDEPSLRVAENYLKLTGNLDSRSMALMFNFLRENELVWNNVINNYLLGKDPTAFDVLYWNTDGTRMARKAHIFYMRHICLANSLTRHGELVIKGVPIDLRDIRQDVYVTGTKQDHIVPWKDAWRMTQLVGGSARFALGGSGHVAGVVAPPKTARGYWTNDKPAPNADAWLESATFNQGSWWLDWAEWLKVRSGEQVVPPSMGNETYPPLMPAPGMYVLEK